MPSPRTTTRQLGFSGLLITAVFLTACDHLRTRAEDDAPSDLAEQRHEKAITALQELSAELKRVEPSTDTPPVAEAETLWDRIRSGFQLEAPAQRRVQNSIDWYARHQAYLDRTAERAEPYLHLIVESVEDRGLPMELALLPVVESAYQPFAYSHGRAAGLWQFIPGTGRRFGLKQSWWYDGRRDVVSSTRAALDYLAYLHRHFDNDWMLALAAYNSGEGTVRKAIRRNRRRGKPTDFWSLDLPRETRGYVPKLLAISAIVADPEEYGVTLKPIADEPVVTTVEIGSQIDLALAAKLLEISIEDLYRYNPAFNRWATDPEGPHRLLVPLDKAELFEKRLGEYPKAERVQWKRHRIRSGDNLATIARRYRTTVSLLKKVNGIRGSFIRAGDSLIIPVAREKLASYRLSAEQRRKSTQRRKQEGHRLEYVVRRGDSLWEISRRYQVGVNELARWNGMAPRDPLLPGRRLVIWVDSLPQEASTGFNPVNFSHPQSDSTKRRIGYIVRRGDSLSRISKRFRVTVNDLRRWNNLAKGRYLQPGQRLTLYVDITAQAGNI